MLLSLSAMLLNLLLLNALQLILVVGVCMTVVQYFHAIMME